MKNPAAVEKPKVNSPIPMGQKSKLSLSSKTRKNKGNLPYLRFRRKLRKDMLGKM